MNRSPNKLIPEDFTAIPSLERSREVKVAAVAELDEAGLDAIGVVVTTDGDLPDGLDLDRAALDRAGFEAQARFDAGAAATALAHCSWSSAPARRAS